MVVIIYCVIFFSSMVSSGQTLLDIVAVVVLRLKKHTEFMNISNGFILAYSNFGDR